MLANNEFEEAWLDEGFNTYMTDRVLQQVYGSDRVVLPVFGLNFPLGIDIRHPVDTNRRYFEMADWDVLASESWKFRDRSSSYGANVYSKTALTMATLERLLGTPEMDKALRLYADRWRFRHPTTPRLHRRGATTRPAATGSGSSTARSTPRASSTTPSSRPRASRRSRRGASSRRTAGCRRALRPRSRSPAATTRS